MIIAEALDVPLHFFLEKQDHHLDPDSILEVALNSQPDLTLAERNMAMEFIRFLKER